MTVRTLVLGLAIVAAGAPAIRAHSTTPEAVTQPAASFPADTRIGLLDFQRIAATSAEGKAAMARLEDLRTRRMTDLSERNTRLQALQTKLVEGAAVLSDQARAQLQRDIDRAQVDIQRFAQDADTELEELQRTLLTDFQAKVAPVVVQLAQDKGLHVIFDVAEAGLAWFSPALDLSAEIVARLDAAAGAAGSATPPGAPEP